MIRFLPLLLITLTLGCLVGASGEEDAPQTTGAGGLSSAAEASNARVVIATMTPVVQAVTMTERLTQLPLPTATASATPEPTETPEPDAASLIAIATDTPEPEPTDTATPEPEPTDTPTPLPTATATPQSTATETATPTGTATATATPSPTATTVISTGSFQSDLLAGHNQARAQGGIGPLSLHGTLNQLAQQRAQTMANSDTMSHYNPDGTTVFDMMNAIGHPYSPTGAAENVGWNVGYSASRSVEVVMQQWIQSPPHYANIMKGNLRNVGFGMATSSSGKVYYAAVFSD